MCQPQGFQASLGLRSIQGPWAPDPPECTPAGAGRWEPGPPPHTRPSSWASGSQKTDWSLGNRHLRPSYKGPRNRQESNISEPQTMASQPWPQGQKAGDTPHQGALTRTQGSSSLLPQTYRVQASPSTQAQARPFPGRGIGAYPGPWPGSCCRSRQGCRACARRPTPPCRCRPRRSRPPRSPGRAAPTEGRRATPPSS